VQRLRSSEIKEEIAKKKRGEWFNRDRLMAPPKMIWKEKRTTANEHRDADDMVAAQNSENNRDAPTYMDVDLDG
jgi:hypothetical protein